MTLMMKAVEKNQTFESLENPTLVRQKNQRNDQRMQNFRGCVCDRMTNQHFQRIPKIIYRKHRPSRQ